MYFQAWKPSPSAWVVQMRNVSNTNYSQAANTFRQLCGHLQPWCWMRSWQNCGCGYTTVSPDRLSEEAALPPVACHKTDLLPNLPPTFPFQTISICQTREEECSLIGCGSCHEVSWRASSSTRQQNDAITHTWRHKPIYVCVEEWPKSFFAPSLPSYNRLKHVFWEWNLQDQVLKTWVLWSGNLVLMVINFFIETGEFLFTWITGIQTG